MFEDKDILRELSRIVNQLHISGDRINFRNRYYGLSSENIRQGLTNILYAECYALKEAYQSGSLSKKENIIGHDQDFLNLLSDSNHSKDRTEHGWLIQTDYKNGYAEIAKHDQIRVVPMSAIRGVDSVFFPKEDRYRQPTFYYVFSDQHFDVLEQTNRVYWNISSEGAPVLIGSITKILNHYKVPFMFKCLSHPALYFRRDAAVLYVDDTVMPMLRMLLPEIYHQVEKFLDDDVPLFSCKYQGGIGLAESPNKHESFGMNRMAILADALLAIQPKMLYDTAAIQEIAAVFLQKGINPARPHLNKGSRILN